jgi:hypothetical protein
VLTKEKKIKKMNKFFFAIAISLFVLVIFFDQKSYSQESTINKKNANQVSREEKTFYDDGKLESIKTYKNDKLDGLSVDYSVNGKTKNETYFKSGYKNGIHREYNSATNALEIEEYYINDTLNGIRKVFNDKGVILMHENYMNGKQHGTQIGYKKGRPVEFLQYEMGEELSSLSWKDVKYVEKIQKKLNADTLFFLEDGGFYKIRNKETRKWGLYTILNYPKHHFTKIIPCLYDSISFKGSCVDPFTVVWNNGKLGVVLFEYDGSSYTETVPCMYEAGKIIAFEPDGFIGYDYYLKVQKMSKWGLVDWKTGAVLVNFDYDLPTEIKIQEYLNETKISENRE